jgi:hypothetical protein
MAGGAQGGGGRPAVGGNLPQYQNMLQNYRQGAMGMPSQVPGANVAAPGGGMPQQFGMAKPAVMPQGPQMSQPLPMAPQQPPQISQPLPMAPQGPQMSQPLPMAPQGQPSAPQQPQMSPEMMAQLQAAMQQQMASQQTQVNGAPQSPMKVGSSPPLNQPRTGGVMPQGPMQAQPIPRPMPMPQVMGNPNAMPLQRPQLQGRVPTLRGRR